MSGISYAGTSTGGQIVVGGAVVATIDSGGITSAGTVKAQPAAAANDAVVLSQAFGVGQTWHNVTSSRAFGVTYTNTTGKTIVAMISGINTGSVGTTGFVVNTGGILIDVYQAQTSGPGNMNPSCTVIIAPGDTYNAGSSAGCNLNYWAELY